MQTLKANYVKNVDIMRENLKRGMTAQQANNIVDRMQLQFNRAQLLGENEKAYLRAMRATIVEHFSRIEIERP
jgi:hypothetical protein